MARRFELEEEAAMGRILASLIAFCLTVRLPDRNPLGHKNMTCHGIQAFCLFFKALRRSHPKIFHSNISNV
jgi:hypothetical protein